MKFIKRKILTIFVISGLVFFGLCRPVEVKAVIPVHDFAGYVLSGIKASMQYLTNFAIGLPGSGGALGGALKTAKAPCKGLEKSYQIANTADTFPTADILAANSVQITKLTTKITALTTVRSCLELVLVGVEPWEDSSGIVAGLQGVTAANANDADLYQAIRALDNRIDRLIELRTDAVKTMWEGVATRIFLTAQNKLVTKLVNQLIAKYKIGNYLKYGDALATQVYNVEFAQNNYPDKMDQAIVKSVMQSSPYQQDLAPIVRVQAQSNLGFDPQTLDFNDPQFYSKMMKVGMGSNDPYMLNTVYTGMADDLKANGQTAAKQEISQGQGIMSLRNCQGISQQEKTFDLQMKQVSADVDTKQSVYNNLFSKQLSDPKSVKAEDIIQASKDLAQAKAKLQALPKANGSVWISRCNDLVNPGGSISQFVNSYLQSHLVAANTADKKNLPFITSFAETVASGFIDNVIQNGLSGTQSLTANGFSDTSVIPAAVIGVNPSTNMLKSAEDYSIKHVSNFSASNDQIPGQFILNWDTSALGDFSSILISTQAGFNYRSVNPSGKITVKGSPGTVFTLSVFDSQGKLTNTSTVTLPVIPNITINIPQGQDQASLINGINGNLKNNGLIPPEPTPTAECSGNFVNYQTCLAATNDELYCTSICGTVHGAFTSQPSAAYASSLNTSSISNIRGPVGISPRGSAN